MSQGTVIVFARAPELGRVKTRLAAEIGADAALELYRAFLCDSLELVRRAGARALLAHTGATAFPEASAAEVCVAQRGATFGERVDNAFVDARAHAPDGPLLMIGADAPHLAPTALARAIEALGSAPAVLGPTPGGGFYVVGFAGAPTPIASAFGGAGEAARAVRLLRHHAVAPAVLATFFDVDIADDLIGLILHLELLDAARASWVPPRTRAAIARLGFAVASADGTRGHVLTRR